MIEHRQLPWAPTAKRSSSYGKTKQIRLSGSWWHFILAAFLCWICDGIAASDYRTLYACEGSTLRIECESAELVEIVRANFGRYSISICNALGNTDWSVKCSAPRSLSVLKDSCDGHRACAVVSVVQLFGDPCPGSGKYLEVQFRCNTPAITTTTTEVPQPPWHKLYPDPTRWLSEVANSPAVTSRSTTTSSPKYIPSHNRSLSEPDSLNDQHEFIDKNNMADTEVKTLKSGSKTDVVPVIYDSSVFESQANTGDAFSEENHHNQEEEREEQDAVIRVKVPDISVVMGGHQQEHMEISGWESAEEPSEKDHVPEEITVPPPGYTTSTATAPLNRKHADLYSPVWNSVAVTGAPQSSVDTPSAPPSVEDSAAARICGATSASGLLWPATAAGQLAVLSCPGAGHARWRCQTSDSWTAAGPDLSECRSRTVSALEQRLLGGERTLRVAAELVQLSRPTAPLLAGDVCVVSRMLSQLATRLARQLVDGGMSGRRARRGVALQLTESVVRTASHLLHADHRAAWHQLRAEGRRRAVTTLLIGLEQVAFLLADYMELDTNAVQVEDNLVLSVHKLRVENAGDVVYPPVDAGNWSAYGDMMVIPKTNLLNHSRHGSVALTFFSTDGLVDMLRVNDSTIVSEDSESVPRPARLVNSHVVAASIGEGRHVSLGDPVRFTLRHLVTENVTNPSCSFWDYTINSWSSEGCWVVATNTTHTSCECSHLTSFAVLMEHCDGSDWCIDDPTPWIAVYAGCGVALLCFTVALLALAIFNRRNSGHFGVGLPSGSLCSLQKHQLASLLAAELCLLVGVQIAGGSAVCCGVLTGLSQFWLLAVFSWQLLDALQLYAQLVELECSAATRLRCCYAAGYGLPLLVVAISCVVDTSSYGSNKHCWLRADNYYILSFAVPAAITVTICAVVLALSGYVLLQHYTAAITVQTKERPRLSFMRGWLRSCLMMLLLLLLVLCLALSFLELKAPLLAYLFSASNVLLGIFVLCRTWSQGSRVHGQLLEYEVSNYRSPPQSLQLSPGSARSMSVYSHGHKIHSPTSYRSCEHEYYYSGGTSVGGDCVQPNPPGLAEYALAYGPVLTRNPVTLITKYGMESYQPETTGGQDSGNGTGSESGSPHLTCQRCYQPTAPPVAGHVPMMSGHVTDSPRANAHPAGGHVTLRSGHVTFSPRANPQFFAAVYAAASDPSSHTYAELDSNYQSVVQYHPAPHQYQEGFTSTCGWDPRMTRPVDPGQAATIALVSSPGPPGSSKRTLMAVTSAGGVQTSLDPDGYIRTSSRTSRC